MKRFAAMLIALAVIVAGAFEWEAADFKAPGPAAKSTVVLIEPRSGVSKTAHALEDAGVIKHAYLFEIGVRLRGMASSLQACIGSVANGLVAGVIAPLVMHSTRALATASLLMMSVGLVSWVYLKWRWPDTGRHAIA